MDFYHKETPIIHNQTCVDPIQVQDAVSRAVWVGEELTHSRTSTYFLNNYGSGTVPGAGHGSCLLGAHKQPNHYYLQRVCWTSSSLTWELNKHARSQGPSPTESESLVGEPRNLFLKSCQMIF